MFRLFRKIAKRLVRVATRLLYNEPSNLYEGFAFDLIWGAR